MTLALSTAVRASRLQAFVDALAGGSVTFYAGTRPAFGTMTGLDPQASATLNTPAATVSGTLATLSGPVEGLRMAGSPISWARFSDASNNPVADCDVSTVSAGTGDIRLDQVTGSVGGFVQLTGGTIAG